MLEIAAVASRANELVLAGQRDELADDKGDATGSPPLNMMAGMGSLFAASCNTPKSLVWKAMTMIMPKQFIRNA